MKMYSGDGFVRIGKRAAKKLYDNGETIYLCACKLRPGGFWKPEIAIVREDASRTDESVQYFAASDSDFDKIVDEFTYYNCGNGAGHYPSYYIKK